MHFATYLWRCYCCWDCRGTKGRRNSNLPKNCLVDGAVYWKSLYFPGIRQVWSPTKVCRNNCAAQAVDDMMQRDENIEELLVTLRANGISLSTTTTWKGWHLLEWTRCGTAFCQLIHAPNCAKQLEWVCQNLGRCHVVWWNNYPDEKPLPLSLLQKGE